MTERNRKIENPRAKRVKLWLVAAAVIVAAGAVAFSVLPTITKRIASVDRLTYNEESVSNQSSAPQLTKRKRTGLLKPSPAEAVTLQSIMASARSWRPGFMDWYSSPAPDFAVKDITGKGHKLSDYRGKDVLVIFWATWCPPCLAEIPHLIELRNEVGEDKLAMLAISYENPGKISKFVADRKINYTVAVPDTPLPLPFGRVTAIPTTFFIDAEGDIKLAAEGMLPSSKIKAILKAEFSSTP